MGAFFGSIYCWLQSFFGIELANYLWGMSSPGQSTNMFIGIGLVMLFITLFVVLLFYYVINHPKLNNWWGWLIFLVINAVINFLIGWRWVWRDYHAGLMVKKDAVTGGMVNLPIGPDEILAFGVTNMIDAIIAFVIFSFILKWWSTNVSRAPF